MVSEHTLETMPAESGALVSSDRLAMIAQSLMRYGLVLVIGWIGAMKFTPYEAQAIQPMVANSPLLGWVYQIFGAQSFSNLLGVVELAIALMIGLRPLSPKIAAVGSGLAVLMFVTTITFLFTTPRLGANAGRFSGTVGGARSVFGEGCGLARRRGLAAGRGTQGSIN